MPTDKKKSYATLTLTIEYDEQSLPAIIEAAKEVVEKATEQAKVDGYLDIHRTSRIPISELQD